MWLWNALFGGRWFGFIFIFIRKQSLGGEGVVCFWWGSSIIREEDAKTPHPYKPQVSAFLLFSFPFPSTPSCPHLSAIHQISTLSTLFSLLFLSSSYNLTTTNYMLLYSNLNCIYIYYITENNNTSLTFDTLNNILY